MFPDGIDFNLIDSNVAGSSSGQHDPDPVQVAHLG